MEDTRLSDSMQKAAEAMREFAEANKGPVSARQARRGAARHDARLAKSATRKYRRSAIEGLQNQQTALGLARVYLGGAGNAAMRENVFRHIDALSTALARQNHPDFWDEDVLSVEDHNAQIESAVEEAHGQIVARLQEVLDAQ